MPGRSFQPAAANVSDRLAVLPQYLLPKRALTSFAGWVAGGRWGGITTGIIRRFIRRYGVNMEEAQQPDPAAYATFNDFFTRALKPGARPMAQADLVCPVGRLKLPPHLPRSKDHHWQSSL